MTNWRICPAGVSHLDDLAGMRTSLWPESSLEEHRHKLAQLMLGITTTTVPICTFVALDGNDNLIGFVEAELRSHADGCDPSRPVGYVEGWFVREAFRNRGVGKELIRAAEGWARAQGCVEMAWDAFIDNQASHLAHEALGFEVVDRCVRFRKAL